ncbi:PKD-like domain-containing protein, partial [uncultured Pedobacter sp.]|uniref:PKD-like domain-containing protein n=1 Tax=uncultured Pedobacter sp. TaxID=246139 RepID=UPI0025D9D316
MNNFTQLLYSSYLKQNYLKLTSLLLFLMFSAFSVHAQTYKTHYIAPAPWQYWSNANEIVVSTNTAGTTATVKKSDGTLITTLNPTPGNPAVYRFVGDPIGLLKNSINTVLDAAGIIVSGNNPIAVNVRNIASDNIPVGNYNDVNDQYIKGNASLFSFGDAAIGNNFRVGYYRDGDLNGVASNVSTIRPVYSVMAIENNTTVKLNGTAITTLNAGQSYILQAAMGSLVETSGPAVMNTGINVDAPEACGDGAYNPVPPVSSLGSDYVVIRGRGNKTAEQTTVIATEPNTNVSVMNFDHNGVLQTTNNYNLIAAGSFITFPNGISTGNGTGNVQVGDPFSGSRIVATKNVVAYSGTADQCEVDIATLSPLNSCGGSLKAETSKFRSNGSTDLPYFAYLVTKSPTDKVYITTTGGNPVYTNTDIETISGINVRRQLGSTGAYAINFNNSNIGNPNSYFITSNSRITVAMVQSGSNFSMSNFLTPFPEKTLKPTSIIENCASALLSADPISVAPFKWYFNGVEIPGETSSTYRAPLSGSYTVTSMLECGVSSQSLPVTLALCNIDLILNKSVDNPTPAKGSTVTFTITVKNSDIASGAVTGTGNAIGVSATDILPSGYTYVSNTTTAGTTYNPTTGLWSIGSMASGQMVTLTIKAIVKSSGNYNNTATVTGPQADPVLSNNTASVSVVPAGITLTSAAGTDAQSICVGSTSSAITYLITGTPTVSVTGLPAGLTFNSSNSNGNTILTINGGTLSTAGTYNYTIKATYASSTVTTTLGSVTVIPPASTPLFAANLSSTRCQGAGVESYTATATSTTGITYSISPANSGVIDAATGTVTWSANYNGTATITAVAASPCGSRSANYTVTINPTGTISGSGTVCSGSNGTLTLTGAPTTVVRWESSTDNINWTTITNTTTTLSYSNIQATTIYRAIVSGGGCTNAISGTATVTVTPRPVIADQTYYICKTGSFSFNPVYAPNGTTYTWSAPSLSSSNITGGTAGTGQSAVNQTLTNTGTTLQTATYTVTPTYASCAGNTFTITVYVVPTLTASATGTTICSSSAFSVTPNSNVNGTTYTWTAALITGTASGFSDQSTAVAGPISQTLSNTSGADATVRYTVTPIYNGCSGATFSFNVIVKTAISAPTASNQTFCEISNAKVANLVTTSGSNIRWYNTLTGGTALAPTAPLTNGNYYASQTNANGCESDRAAITVSITATPAPTVSNQTFCEVANATVANLVTTSGTNVKWYSTSTGGTALASTTALTNGTYYASQTVNGCESASRSSITVTIYQTPKGFNDTKTLNCLGNFSYDIQNANINNTTNGGNAISASFTWTINSNSNVTGATSGSGNTINQTLINTSNVAQTIIYTVTPKATITGGCVGNPFTVTVNVPVCLLAVDDNGIGNSATGGIAVANVLLNDTYNGGVLQANLTNVTITNGTNDSNGKVNLDPATGKVSVAPNTPAGVYTLTYTITDKLDASKVSTATVKVTVASGAILAKDDAGTANSVTGGTAIANVLANDNYNGTTTAPALTDVTITNGTNDSNGKVSLDPATGAINVAPNTPAGVYTLTYTITDKLDA